MNISKTLRSNISTGWSHNMLLLEKKKKPLGSLEVRAKKTGPSRLFHRNDSKEVIAATLLFRGKQDAF